MEPGGNCQRTGGILKEQKLPGIRIQEYRQPVSVKNGVYDFGRNLSGDVEITLDGQKGIRWKSCMESGLTDREISIRR